MEAICTLELDDNRCQYLAADKKHCTAVHTECGFYVVVYEWFDADSNCLTEVSYLLVGYVNVVKFF